MRLLRHHRVMWGSLWLAILILGIGRGAFAQTMTTTPPAASLVAYRCEFQPETNSARIRAVLLGSDGLPIPQDAYTVTVTAADSGAALSADRVTTTAVATRPPLQLILVLDLTETVPIQQIVNAVSERLMPQLQVLDEVALITFGEEISLRTQFYTDKNRLLNEQMLGLAMLPGENRLYDAMLNAVLDLPLGGNMRQVVLVITDSGRRELVQATADTIIAEAQDAKIQVFSIGFQWRDQPDAAELTAIANGSGGYAWIYQATDASASIQSAVGGHLDDFVRALNSEILLTVSLHGLEPDANRRITFTVSVQAANELPLSHQISCPVEALNHSIAFIDDLDGQTITETTDIGVTVDSDMSLEETTVVFWVNDEIVQNSTEHNYLLNAPELQPGYYTIGAQLRDRYNQTLATTPTQRVFLQQELQLNLVDQTDTVSSGITRFEVIGNPNLTLPGVNFVAAAVADPRQTHLLNDAPVPFEADGTIRFHITDLPGVIERLFPDLAEGDTVQIRAVIANPSATDPELAVSNNVTYRPVIPPPLPKTDFMQYAPVAAIIFLSALNILLFRLVKQMRIRRIIKFPDDYELSPQLMSLTVRRETGKQTHTLTKKTIYIGRGSSNDINLGDDANISRQHGVVMWRRENWYYSNRKRRIKTRINGKWVKGYAFYKLEAVTELELGNVYLVFHSNAQRDLSDFITTNL